MTTILHTGVVKQGKFVYVALAGSYIVFHRCVGQTSNSQVVVIVITTGYNCFGDIKL